MEIVPVRWIDKVLEIALERHPVPLTDAEVAAVSTAAAVAKADVVPDPNIVTH